jgi:hypothetical protein
MRAHARKALDGGVKRTGRSSPVIAGQDADVIMQTLQKLDRAAHGTRVHIHVQVTDVEDGEPVKQGGKFL